MAGKSVPIELRLNRKSVTVGGCKVWQGYKIRGYGQVEYEGRARLVHRVAWELANGPIPDGMEVDHVCFNRACLNIEHLRLVTHKQNNEYRQGAQRNNKLGIRGVSKFGSKFRAVVVHNGKQVHLGLFDSAEEAERAAIRARLKYFTHSDVDRPAPVDEQPPEGGFFHAHIADEFMARGS